MLTKIINNKLKEIEKEQHVYQPQFFRLHYPQDAKLMQTLLEEKPFIKIYDTLHAQLRELIKTSAPKVTLSNSQIEDGIAKHLGDSPPEEYGVWVYYPWNEKLVHILDEKEFVFMRTNRNKYKITDEEEEILSRKIVGVVGLSVGQAVSVTMAMERTFGELRIADFDDLEITNLNRLRSSLYNMGLKKTIQVSRDIAEIDPFLKITVFSDGLTTDNIDAFFTDGGKLDLIIDECDGLDMKILLRHKAKSLKVPVLMEASDKGTVDVERFDLEPDRPILHGFIDHLDHTKIGHLTNDEKIPYIMPMLGLETISKRLRASMVEIKQTVSTWPQLASAVSLGGALCADVYRRIMLNKYTQSGRYFVDIEELIGDKPLKMEGKYTYTEITCEELTTEKMLSVVAPLQVQPSEIEEQHLIQIAQAAVDAPSAANNQPWKLLSQNNILYIFHDRKQSYSWTDQEDFIAQIGLGAAIENVNIKAASLGYKTSYQLFPAGKDALLIANIAFTKTDEKHQFAELATFIGSRCTSRKKGDNKPLDNSILESLTVTGTSIENNSLTFLTDQESINQFADIESAAERVRSLHPQSHYEFFHKEIRWNKDGNEHITEGLDIKTLELTIGEEMGMKIASDPAVIALLNNWKTGKAFEKIINQSIRTSSAVGLLTVPAYNPVDIINGGRAVERIWLDATKQFLSLQPISAPLFLHARIKYGDVTGENLEMLDEIHGLYGKLCTLFPELTNRHGLFLFRLFNGEPPTARSLRKSLDELYTVA